MEQSMSTKTRRHSLITNCIAPSITAVAMMIVCASALWSQVTPQRSVIGQVTDEQGGAITGVQVTITGPMGNVRTDITDNEGRFEFPGVALGSYILRVAAKDFSPYENPKVDVVLGRDTILNVTLHIAAQEQTIAVLSENPLVGGADYIGGNFVISGEALESLVGAGGVEAVLRALTVRSAGPLGPQALVNGFADNVIPPVHTIREIRINANPYSTEYPTPGVGRVEILTKPGTQGLHAQAFGNVGDAQFNSRNPFAPVKVRYQSRNYGGYLSGPIWPKRSTFFIDFNKREVDTNAVINATIVDSAWKLAPLKQAVVTPETGTSLSGRIDYQLSSSNTVIARYSDARSRSLNSGVGEFSLTSRAQDLHDRVQTFQITDTAVLNPHTVHEIRAQYVRSRASRFGDNSMPVIYVSGAFKGGGADVGVAYTRARWGEVYSSTSWQTGKHFLKTGLQGRYTTRAEGSTQNFGGTYTFGSRIAPQLNDRNEIIIGREGTPVMIPITTVEAYRRTVLFQSQNLSSKTIRERGGGASQFSVTTGDVETQLQQYQLGAFIQDEWRLHPKFTLSAGLRYERQNNIKSDLNFAPRIAFAWGLGRGQTQPKTVLRVGVGLFYDRVGEPIVLRTRRMDGVHQQQYFVSDTAILDLFPAVPSQNVLAGFAISQSRVQLAGDLRSPYTLHSSIAIDRQLLQDVSVSASFSRIRGFKLLRSRNINAPLPGTYDPAFPQSAVRPLGTSADIFQYESTGVLNQKQFMVNLVYRHGKDLSLWSTYTLSESKSDTDNPDTFPANSYDLHSEYGASGLDARHSWYWGGWIRTFGGLELTPLVVWRSGVPFDITTGRDSNGDSLFTDRPAFATDISRPSVVTTQFGVFDLNPTPEQQIIPRNFGKSAGFFMTNLRVSRRFFLNDSAAVTIGVQGQNIFNRTNPGLPVGNLGSPSFGMPSSSAGDWGFGSNQAGNRRFEGLLYFSF
jgi:hypothetical protein